MMQFYSLFVLCSIHIDLLIALNNECIIYIIKKIYIPFSNNQKLVIVTVGPLLCVLKFYYFMMYLHFVMGFCISFCMNKRYDEMTSEVILLLMVLMYKKN